MKGHWSRICRTSKYLIELYQESLKDNGENIEANLAHQDDDFKHDHVDMTHLDVADFFENLEGRIDHLIGDGNVQK